MYQDDIIKRWNYKNQMSFAASLPGSGKTR